MRQVERIGYLVLILLIIAGCASSKKSRNDGAGKATPLLSFETAIASVKENNITPDGFVIQRGDIELSGTPIEGRFGFNARMNDRGDIVISVRGPLGIEIVRFLSVGNDLCMIDRFGKTAYTGKKNEIMKRYGLPENFVEIMFGDLPAGSPETGISSGEELILEYNTGDYKNEVTICLQESKVCKEYLLSGNSKSRYELIFNEFITNEGLKYASEITIKEQEKLFHVKLNIYEMTGGFTGLILFTIPDYKRKAL